MNNFNSDITKSLLESFRANRIITSSVNDMFKIAEDERIEKFKAYRVALPWYLWPFKLVITSIAYKSFKDGLAHDNQDTVKFRRPTEYKEARDD